MCYKLNHYQTLLTTGTKVKTRDPSDTQASWRRKKTRVVVAADKEIEKVIRQLLRTKLEEILVQAVLTGGSVEAK